VRAKEFVNEADTLVATLANTISKSATGQKSSAPATTQPGTGTVTGQAPGNNTTAPTTAPATPPPAGTPAVTNSSQTAPNLTPQQIKAALPAGKKLTAPGVTGQVEVLPSTSGEDDINLRIPNIGDVEVDPATISKLAGIATK